MTIVANNMIKMRDKFIKKDPMKSEKKQAQKVGPPDCGEAQIIQNISGHNGQKSEDSNPHIQEITSPIEVPDPVFSVMKPKL